MLDDLNDKAGKKPQSKGKGDFVFEIKTENYVNGSMLNKKHYNLYNKIKKAYPEMIDSVFPDETEWVISRAISVISHCGWHIVNAISNKNKNSVEVTASPIENIAQSKEDIQEVLSKHETFSVSYNSEIVLLVEISLEALEATAKSQLKMLKVLKKYKKNEKRT